MLRSPRTIHQLLRQPVIHDGLLLRTALRRNFTGAPNRSIANVASESRVPLQQRSFATSVFRPSNHARLPRTWRNTAFRNGGSRRHNSTGHEQPSQPRTMSDRMKEMSRKYGWIVVGIYLGLSVLDFPFCFLAVKWFGTERIAEIEHAIIDGFWGIVEKGFPALKEKREHKQKLERLANEATREGDGAGIVEYAQGNGKVEEPSMSSDCTHETIWPHTDYDRRHLDPTPPRIRRAQVPYLLPHSSYPRRDSQGRQDAAEMGLEYRQD